MARLPIPPTLASVSPTSAAERRRTLLPLLAVLLLALAVRLPGVTRPLLGNFATKNVIHAMIARNWATGRAPFTRPTLDVLAGGLPAWHLVELPLPAYAAGALWHALGGSLDAWGRGVSIAASVAAAGWLFVLVRRCHGPTVALAAALAWCLAPVSVVYGQAFMLEPAVAWCSLVAIDAADRFGRQPRARWLLLLALATTALWLTKIYLVVLIPVLLAAAAGALPSPCLEPRANSEPRPNSKSPSLSAVRANLSLKWRMAVVTTVLALALLPAVWWYAQVWQITAADSPERLRVFYSIRQSIAVHSGPVAWWIEPTFWWHLLRDLATVVLTPVGLLLALAGVHRVGQHAAWLAASVALVLLLPGKFHELNYYFVVVLPVWCLLVGLGWQALSEHIARQRRWALAGLLCGCLCSARYAINPGFVTPKTDQMLVAAGAAVDSRIPTAAQVVAIHGAAPDLLYYTARQGWSLAPDHPQFARRLAAARAGGAHWAVVTSTADALPHSQTSLLDDWLLVAQGPGYRVLRSR